MEELDDGEGETLVVCHGDGGSDLSVVTEGGRDPASRRERQLACCYQVFKMLYR